MKVSAFADDMLLCLTDPQPSLEGVLTLIHDFGAFSGLKINVSKSVVLDVGGRGRPIWKGVFPLVWAEGEIKYLGIQLPDNPANLYKANVPGMVNRARQTFMKWRGLPLSLKGRIALFTMVEMPRWLYVLRILPLWVRGTD